MNLMFKIYSHNFTTLILANILSWSIFIWDFFITWWNFRFTLRLIILFIFLMLFILFILLNTFIFEVLILISLILAGCLKLDNFIAARFIFRSIHYIALYKVNFFLNCLYLVVLVHLFVVEIHFNFFSSIRSWYLYLNVLIKCNYVNLL